MRAKNTGSQWKQLERSLYFILSREKDPSTPPPEQEHWAWFPVQKNSGLSVIQSSPSSLTKCDQNRHKRPRQSRAQLAEVRSVHQEPSWTLPRSAIATSLRPFAIFAALFLTNEVSFKHVLTYRNLMPAASNPGRKQLLSNLIRRGSGKGQGSSPGTPDCNNSRRL